MFQHHPCVFARSRRAQKKVELSVYNIDEHNSTGRERGRERETDRQTDRDRESEQPNNNKKYYSFTYLHGLDAA